MDAAERSVLAFDRCGENRMGVTHLYLNTLKAIVSYACSRRHARAPLPNKEKKKADRREH